MHIEKFKLNGIVYLRLAESYSTMVNGVSKQKKRSLYHIGPLHRYDDGDPNYLERLRQSFRQGNPLIAELEPYVQMNRNTVSIEFDRSSEDQTTAVIKYI